MTWTCVFSALRVLWAWMASSSRPLRDSSRRSLPRWHAVDPSPLSFLSARQRTQSRLPREVRRRLETTISDGPTHFRRNSQAASKPESLLLLLAPPVPSELGRLCQATLRRTPSCAGLSRPLHPSRGHHQPPSPGLRARSGYLPLEGLCPRQ